MPKKRKLHPLVKCKSCKKAGYSYCIHVEQRFPKPAKTPKNKTREQTLRPVKTNEKLVNTVRNNESFDYKKQSRKVRDKLIKSLKRRKMNKRDKILLGQNLGLMKSNNNLNSAASVKGRSQFQEIISKQFISSFGDSIGNFDFFHITIVDDKFFTLDRAPKLDLYSMKEKLRGFMRHEPDLEFIATLDASPFTNFPRNGLGCTQSFHWHVLAWRKKRETG